MIAGWLVDFSVDFGFGDSGDSTSMIAGWLVDFSVDFGFGDSGLCRRRQCRFRCDFYYFRSWVGVNRSSLNFGFGRVGGSMLSRMYRRRWRQT
jgi:hypothetical protein